jgi:3-phenylpropionate/trans-cinnamate dioxygenase ferredoxin reductase component
LAEARPHIVVVGAGHAGGSAVAMLRQFGWTDAVTLVGAEPLPPYQRPPLSKAWLKGEADGDSLLLRPAQFYPDQDIALLVSTQVTAIERATKQVCLADGPALSYDHLILALGSRPRRIPLPGIDLPGVLELRTAADADQLKAALGPDKHIAIIGGGYIGLEVAASARALGAAATILEREDRVLARVACQALSDFFHAYHQARGVAFELGCRIEALEGNDAVTGVRLSDGRVVACDAVLVGVGAVANDELARDAGLACDNGIIVDLAARTADPAIFAIGDCTRRPLPLYARDWRLESVPNALEQAKQAAAAICGRPPPAPEVPWFWSDQYDLRLQIAGMPFDATQVVLRGAPADGKFAVFHLAEDDRLLAVEAVNAPPEFLGGKMMIGRRQKLRPERIRDLSISVRDLPA